VKLLAQMSGLCVFSLYFAVSSVADTIELEATGTVTSSGFASVPAGTPLTAFLFYNSATVPILSDSGHRELCRPTGGGL
jgi:hypothetical protein